MKNIYTRLDLMNTGVMVDFMFQIKCHYLQIKPHQCEFCGKEFFSRKDYGEHTRTHTTHMATHTNSTSVQ